MNIPANASARKPLTCDRLGRLLAGGSVLGALALAQWVSPWFLLVVVGTALNLLVSGITDRCAVRSLLIRMGFPRERDVGRAEAAASMDSSSRRSRFPNRLARTGGQLRRNVPSN